MKNSIKRAQSRAGSSFAERENFRPKVKQLKKTLLTLVALLAVTTGAWAQTETLLTTITATAQEQASYSTANVATVSFSYTSGGSSAYLANWGWWGYGWIATVNAAEGYTITKCVFYDDANRTATDSEAPFVVETTEEDKTPRINETPIDGGNQWSKGIMKIEVYGYVTPAPPSGPEVAWDKDKNTGTFTMPGGNVTLEPEYYPQATVADGAVTAADADARATTDDPLVKVDATKLTGAKKLMYFVSNSGTTAPAYDAEGWTDQLPTAKGLTEAGIVYVWYYPVGTDEGVDGATATYSDGDICLQSITARIADAPTYAVTFKAANDNTIEAGKATVTVDGTDKTSDITEGKLQGVKMGSEVKVKAKEGYKFRKVEVKKAAPALKTLTVKGMQLKYVEGDTWQQAIERPENEGSSWRVQNNYIFNGGYTLFINEGAYVYVRPGDTIDATKNYSLEAD